MAVYADRVLETTTTTGTGTYNLAGAEPGHQTFVAGVGSTSVVTYVVEDGTDWEVGEGTVTSGTPDTLSRTSILASSNSNAAVNWGAGSKNVFLTAAAARTVFNDKDNTLTGRTFVPDGSLGSPSIAFSSDTDVGLYCPGANQLAVSVGTSTTTAPLIVNAENNATNGISVLTFNGGFPDIVSHGTDTNIGLGFFAKGTGNVVFGNDGGSYSMLRLLGGADHNQILEIDHSPTFTDIQLSAGSGNYSIDISTVGTTTAAQINLYARVSTVYRNLFAARPGATLSSTTNYITAYANNAGTAPAIEAEGGDANINLDLFGKGTGSIRLNGTATTISSAGAITTSQVITGTAGATFSNAIVSSGRGFASAEFSAGSGAPGTINWNNGQNQVRTLTSSGSLTLSNPTNGATYKLRIVQGGSGSYTITWPTIKWAGGVAPTLSTAVGAEDIITLYYNGTSYYGVASTGFA